MYALSLVNEDYCDSEDYYHHYTISEKDNQNEILKGLEFVFVELNKFKLKNFKDKKMHFLWLKFLTEIEDSRNIHNELSEIPEIKEAIEYLEESNYTDAELEYYDRYWDMVSTEKTLHRELQEKALKKGLEQGLEQGMEKGIEQSIIEMYKNKLPIPDIAKYLNKDQVYVEKVIARYLRNKPL